MKITFLGTGGAIPTPRPFCECEVCEKARNEGEPYKRNSSSMYIEEINGLFDCPEDIGDSLNRRRISRVDNLFITHWHPDHTFGLRPLLQANYNFITGEAEKVIDAYIPRKVYEELKSVYPTIEFLEKVLNLCNVHLVENGEKIEINGVKITAVGYQGSESKIFAYLVDDGHKRLVYAPCDTIDFNYEIKNVDLLINECGIFNEGVDDEIKFDDLMKIIDSLSVKRTLLTHIEEVDLRTHGIEYYEKMKQVYSGINFDYAFDGMVIKL